MRKIISFDLYADMGFLKKPDINEKVYLTYNMLHKPALLGILGAINGLQGFQRNNELPEYYQRLKQIPIGIQPIGEHCDNGNFSKTITAYNNTTGFASKEEGGNLIISEQTLIRPSFRIYLLLDLDSELEQRLYSRIANQEAEFIPYLGKNDYSAWWLKEEVKEYEVTPFVGERDFKILNLFLKEEPLVDNVVEHRRRLRSNLSFLNGSFMYFEKLPISYNEDLYQYNYGDFAYTDWMLGKDSTLENLYEIPEGVIQLN